MPDWSTVIRHLEELRRCISYLQELRSHTRDEVLHDWRVQSMVERNLQLAIEVVISVAEQLIVLLDLPMPDSGREAVFRLVAADVLSRELGDKMADAVSFRNILVHRYMGIDRDLVYEALQHNVDDLGAFLTVVTRFVEEQLQTEN
jgi:uncharacterized protein YutE (UPF0331/DUF86 family)